MGDVAAANLAAAAHLEAHGAYNIGTGAEASVVEVLGALRRAAGLGEGELEPEFEPARKGELQRSSLDVTRARVELGFTAGTDLVAGMKPTLEVGARGRVRFLRRVHLVAVRRLGGVGRRGDAFGGGDRPTDRSASASALAPLLPEPFALRQTMTPPPTATGTAATLSSGRPATFAPLAAP